MSDHLDQEAEQDANAGLSTFAESEPRFARGTISGEPVGSAILDCREDGWSPEVEEPEDGVDDGVDDTCVSHSSRVTAGCGLLSRMTRRQRERYLDGELGTRNQDDHLTCRLPSTGFTMPKRPRSDLN